jgi:hypothetical protein
MLVCTETRKGDLYLKTTVVSCVTSSPVLLQTDSGHMYFEGPHVLTLSVDWVITTRSLYDFAQHSGTGRQKL